MWGHRSSEAVTRKSLLDPNSGVVDPNSGGVAVFSEAVTFPKAHERCGILLFSMYNKRTCGDIQDR